MLAEVDFGLLFDASPSVLLVLLPDAPKYTMVAATDARLQVTHSTRETLGKGLFEVFPDNPDDPTATGTSNLRASLDRVLATRAPDTMAVQKYDIRGPDGTFQVKYWSPKNIPVLSAQGEVVYVLHRVEDVTELVHASEVGEALREHTHKMEREVLERSRELAEANRELRDANARLGELDAAKTAFFSNVSHEFRTPLTLMLGPLEDALGDALHPLNERQRAHVELAYANALRLLKLVNALLDFSRLEAGRLRPHFEAVDLSALTSELASMFLSAVAREDLRLTIRCPPLSEPAWVDRDMWEKIVPNLVSNAFKFTTQGEISVSLSESDTHVALEVSDTGVGIPEHELPRVFERFHRVEGVVGRTHEGTGIGLSLVRELVALHGGEVRATSAVGRGSTFRVEIPRSPERLSHDAVSLVKDTPARARTAAAHAAEARRWSADDPAPRAPEATNTARARVLVVDDNADLRAYITDLLAPHYDVTTAVDGLGALDAVRARAPDLVVSDVMMPNLNGFGLVRALRESRATATIPVILLSARAGEDAAIEGLDAGSDDYLVKPFSARELLARVRTHLSLAQTRRAWIAELERANRELDAFSYSVSHDLRAPLRAIDGFSAVIAEDYGASLDARALGYLDRIRKSAARMAALIDDLMELARVARAPLTLEPVDLSARVAAIVSDLRAAQPDRAVHVTVADGVNARADPRLLDVVLVNLLGNAWKFTARTPDARIEFGRHPTAPDVFFVRDSGAGFDMAHAAKLFAPFQRLHDARDFQGTGVGLAIVQRAIERHGGRVWAEGAVNQGATLFFSLPDTR